MSSPPIDDTTNAVTTLPLLPLTPFITSANVIVTDRRHHQCRYHYRSIGSRPIRSGGPTRTCALPILCFMPSSTSARKNQVNQPKRTNHTLFIVAGFCPRCCSVFKGRCHCFVRSKRSVRFVCKSGAGTLTGEAFGSPHTEEPLRIFSGFQLKALITRITIFADTNS